VLIACMVSVEATRLDLVNDPEMMSFLEERSLSEAAFQSALETEVGEALTETAVVESEVDADRKRGKKSKKSKSRKSAGAAAGGKSPRSSSRRKAGKKSKKSRKSRKGRRRSSGGGGLMRGGQPKSREPDLSKSSADGETLAPWDPFKIQVRHERRLARRQQKAQAKAEVQNQLDRCRQTRERARRRRANEAREIAAEKAELSAEAANKAASAKDRASKYETDLMEVSAETGADMEAEAAIQAELESEMLESDSEAAEFEADAAESEADFAEQEQEALAELEAVTSAAAWPITYGKEDYNMEDFNNESGHAVFTRRARAKDIIKFSRNHQSTPNAAVAGVIKLQDGREVTPSGLSKATISTTLGATVTASDSGAPVLKDDNMRAIHHLPIVPQFHAEGGLDEYGDPIEN